MARLPVYQNKQPTGGVLEHSFIISEALRNGLSPDPRMPRNSPFLESMSNLRASEFGLVSPEAITNPITSGPTPNWGSAGTTQMFMGENGRWVAGQTTLYTANSSWVASSTGITYTAGGPWQAVIFQELPFFTNGTSLIYFAVGTGYTVLDSSDGIVIPAVGRHENRLLLGGLTGTALSHDIFTAMFQKWKDTHEGDRISYSTQAFDTGWVIFGERGGGASDRPFEAILSLLNAYGTNPRADMNGYLESQLELGNWGMARMRYTGSIMAFHELGDATLVFGQNGVSRLARDGNIYYDVRLHPIGIPGRGCVGGDLYQCLFLDATRNIWTVDPGGAPVRHRMGHNLSDLTLADVTVSFDPVERNYWISDKARGFLFDANGKLSGPFEVFPSSLVRDGASLYGVVRDTRADPTTTAVSFKTLPFDIGERANKHFPTAQVSRENITAMKLGFDYRYDDATAFRSGGLSSAHQSGSVHFMPTISAVDVKLRMTGSVANNKTAVIDRIRVQYQGEDKTFLRGAKGVPDGDGGE